VVVVIRTYLPAWCERRSQTLPDGRFTVACYYTRDGHPVSKAHAERVEITEYAPDGTPLRIQEGIVANGNGEPESEWERDAEVVLTPGAFRFS
jgi:hypothetical protein